MRCKLAYTFMLLSCVSLATPVRATDLDKLNAWITSNKPWKTCPTQASSSVMHPFFAFNNAALNHPAARHVRAEWSVRRAGSARQRLVGAGDHQFAAQQLHGQQLPQGSHPCLLGGPASTATAGPASASRPRTLWIDERSRPRRLRGLRGASAVTPSADKSRTTRTPLWLLHIRPRTRF